MSSPKVILYTAGTPNGHKISIMLEEIGVEYEAKKINLAANEQKEEWFLKINPNGRIPAIVDVANNNFPVFESGSIMLYLADKYDKESLKVSFEYGSAEHWEMVEWLFFLNSGVGPMQGQVHHFMNASEKLPYAINRYKTETRRLYEVLNTRLTQQKAKSAGAGDGPYLAGNKYSVADIANFTWVNIAHYAQIDMEGLDELVSWRDRIKERGAVVKGLDVPAKV